MRASLLVRPALAGLLLHLGTGAVRADPVPYRVDGLPRGETLSIRAEPDPAAEVVGEIRARALVVGCTNDTPSRTTWCRVKVGRTVGWARRRYLAPE
ncbi:SH3 domain-containing protein [Methylobacterium sp. J-059]|uniref:SH3 domain-containing protein n=1 Tax=Methylobacterium sp. J-059 TaxID=2836643 RepID=UPI001FBB4006|nr:SH3 domain-containing protein [Methylobacterium sp. J-059]MCJ2041429.1 SH3 domain-containing protein [Methylobacterium sp. J-059]